MKFIQLLHIFILLNILLLSEIRHIMEVKWVAKDIFQFYSERKSYLEAIISIERS